MKRFIVAAIFALGLAGLSAGSTVSAVDITKNCQSVSQRDCALLNENKLDSSNGRPSALRNGINMALWLLGAISVLMIVVGGFKYTASNGDSSLVSSAKNTIFFAIIGLIVAIMSFAIVNFVVDRL